MKKQAFGQKAGAFLILALMLTALLASLSGNAEMQTVGGTTQPVAGTTEVETKLEFSENPGFFSMELTLSYDAERFTLLSAKAPSGLSASLPGEEKNRIRLLSDGDYKGESFTLVLRFKAKEGTPKGSYPLTCSARAVNEAYETVPVGGCTAQIVLDTDVTVIEKITLSQSEIRIRKNSNAQIDVTFEPEDAVNTKLVYTSSAPKIATVTSTGKITSLSFGTAVITVATEDGKVKAECVVTVPEFTAWEEFVIVFKSLNRGFLQTLKLFGVTLLGAIPLGLLISLGSMSKFKPLSALVRTIVWIVRGSPLMIQLMIIFYFPGMILKNNIWGQGETGRFIAASVAFIVNYACYFSEIYRGGIQGVPKGQQEAGQVLGMRNSQIFFKVKLLQMVKRIVPPMSNEIITLVKDTSLARIIALQEIIWAGDSFMKGSGGITGAIWPLFFTAVYYLVFSGIVTVLLGKLEKKLSYFN